MRLRGTPLFCDKWMHKVLRVVFTLTINTDSNCCVIL